MFDTNSVVTPKLSLAKRLNNALTDSVNRGGFPFGGVRFIARGEIAFLIIRGNPNGAIYVQLGNGEEDRIFFHPYLTGKAAWKLAATTEGYYLLNNDPVTEYIPLDTSIGGWEYHVIGTCFAIIEQLM